LEPYVKGDKKTRGAGGDSRRVQRLSHPARTIQNGQYQTAGIIEKETSDGVKRHDFVRADTHQNMDDAINFTVSKAKQMIDMEGDRIFV
jgi:hypothetical protein